MIKGYKDLDVWKKSMRMTSRIYDITAHFPKTEIYGLASQMRRASVSIPSNIAEGSTRGSTGEYIQFITIARGSLAELETQLLIAYDRKFIVNADYLELAGFIDEVGKMLNKLLQSLRARKQYQTRNTMHEARYP